VEENEKIVEEVLRRLEENDLFLKPEKCSFSQAEVEFLGLFIGPDGIQMDQLKTKAIEIGQHQERSRIFNDSLALPISIDDLLKGSPRSPLR